MAEQPGDSPGFLLWHATLRWQRAIAAALQPLDLTHVQFVLLACTWWLNGAGTHPNQVDLATQAGTDVKMTSQVVRSLERKGLVARVADPLDARAMRVSLTLAGAELAPRAVEVVEAVDARFFSTIELEPALELLRHLVTGRGTTADAEA